MATRDYGALERRVIDVFSQEGSFTLGRERFRVEVVGKPRPQHGSGEPKTDVYILGVNENGVHKELKISLKLESSNEFQENKVSAERAESFFGPEFAQIIQETTRSISERFESQALLYASGRYPTKPDSITLGWKLEIASRPRRLSAPIQLSQEEIRSFIYKGENLSSEKMHAVVNGEVIQFSGVAEYIVYAEIDEIHTTQDVIERMQLIDEVELAPTYLIFTANNYRTREDKCDGARPIAVRVHWYEEDGQLAYQIVYEEPLTYCGRDMVPQLQEALSQVGKSHPSEMEPQDVQNPAIFLP
ncbi:hypothetical protein OCD85_01280 [Bacillus pacificus]|uniref:hypothetical protein n=1 Tax=Bacillus cereus group TaxID=86661 RepID=UPI000944B293|nr:MULTISPECIES: hypothetical protein [Bacillus cereus group]MBD0728251.1 hypothetical protein [Bacillus cereus]MCC2485672.1 hypothetical protein [Bacillus pacificus]MCU4738982.1 hypothetical protein [Bacillus paranthracis]MCU4869128.1 hypothetical protein [Bacillus paranthracis]MCU5075050.1 hypothetical protein [Bacillus paranthracis]